MNNLAPGRYNRGLFISLGAKLINGVTQLISQIEQAAPSVGEHLLPLVFEEMRSYPSQMYDVKTWGGEKKR